MTYKSLSLIVCAGIGVGTAVALMCLGDGPGGQPRASAADAPATTRPVVAAAALAKVTVPPAAVLAPPAAVVPAPLPVVKPAQQDGVATIISERLAPQRQMAAADLVAPFEPRELASRKADVSVRPYLPLSQTRQTPLELPGKPFTPKRSTARSVDAPPLAIANPTIPAAPPLRTVPRHAQQTIIPISPLLRLPLVVRPRMEPVSSSLPTTMNDIVCPPLSMLPAFRTAGAPFVPTVQADPLANQNEIALVTAPPDQDPPVAARAILPRKPMAVTR